MNESLQKLLWEIYVKLEERQRSAFWNLVVSFGIASALIATDGEPLAYLGVKLSKQLIFASAPFFVFVMGGRFYFLSAYLFEAYARVFMAVAKETSGDVSAADLYRSLLMQDLSSGLNVFFPRIRRENSQRPRIWSIGSDVGAIFTPLIAIGVPFATHIAFTAWFVMYGANTLPEFGRYLIATLYVAFFLAASFMVAYLYQSTAASRDAVKKVLSEKATTLRDDDGSDNVSSPINGFAP